MTAFAASDQTVFGRLEGLAGACLIGWAIAPRRPAACLVAVADAAGRVVTTGRADRPCFDPAARDHGAAARGFRIPLPAIGASTALRVYADGIELPGSPLATGPDWWDGALAVQDGWAEGWVHARATPFDPPQVALFDQDGICLGQTQARVATAGSFDPARFRLRLPAAAWARCLLHLRAAAGGVVFATATTPLTLLGWIEQIEPTRCVGWLHCVEAPSTAFELELWRDGELVGHGVADLPRPDLTTRHPDHWRCGFDLALIPPRASDTPLASISLRLAGTAIEVLDGPFLVGPRRALVRPARAAAALASAADPDGALRPVLRHALTDLLNRYRAHPETIERLRLPPARPPAWRRFTVVVPVYRDLDLTRVCIDSVLAHRNPERDALVLVNDASPEPGMEALLDACTRHPNVFVLTNPENLGFVKSANRGLAFTGSGDVILLNSDARVFAGGLDELWRVAHADPGIGTVTALSNNATIFSYPVSNQGSDRLDDIGWHDLAAAALAANRGLAVDVPTGHGFCMLITRAALDRVGVFDEAFGRGYGEENDFCQRAADRGLRNVAACGALVEHAESVSFTEEKATLLRANMQVLERRYPEYAADVRETLRRDDLRAGRWALDGLRLERASAAGSRFVLVLRNWLGGGTRQAIIDIEARIGYDGAQVLDLCVNEDGTMVLACGVPRLRAVFAPGEHQALFALLARAEIGSVLIHQVLGFTEGFVRTLTGFCRDRAAAAGRQDRFHLHDYYALCPRVTMIDAGGRFCNAPAANVCAGCIDLGGAHGASRMTGLAPAGHRALMAELLGTMRRVETPSASAGAYLARIFPDLPIELAPHPEPAAGFRIGPRAGDPRQIVLLGAIGPHKGSATLAQIARHAHMVAPGLRFHVIGHTPIDAELHRIGNVGITGEYRHYELPEHVAAAGGRLALFLHNWPETFSYTLSEAVRLGLVPLVPDIGAPAERVRAAGFGHVFAFPIDPAEVVALICRLCAGELPIVPPGATAAGFACGAA